MKGAANGMCIEGLNMRVPSTSRSTVQPVTCCVTNLSLALPQECVVTERYRRRQDIVVKCIKYRTVVKSLDL